MLEQISGRPLARALVHLNPVPKAGGEAPQALSIRSGISGQFAFNGVSPGLYLLLAERNGYFPTYYGQRLPIGRGTPFEVTDDPSCSPRSIFATKAR